MANDSILTDEVVAEMMAKEASDASIKYSSMGLDAFRSAKPANKAKPNTNFLGRIIKSTTYHNAALHAKAAAEAQSRLDDLTVAEEKKRRKLNPSAGDIRRRQLGDITSILSGGRKRKHGVDDKVAETKNERDGGREKRTREAPSKEESLSRAERRDRDRSRSPRHQSHRHRHRSPLNTDDEQERRSKSLRKGKERERSGADAIIDGIERRKRHGRLDPPESSRKKKDLTQPSSSVSSCNKDGRLADDDSDPLDELIGPAPPPRSPVRPRGRGAARGPSAMDSRFSEGHDPQSNNLPEADEHDEWDEAVELFRDRQKWKQQGADRLRAAGLTDDEIKKWERGGERDIDNVKWTKAGEGREWDRGKDR